MVDEFYDKFHFHGFLALYLSITNPGFRGKTGQLETHDFFFTAIKTADKPLFMENSTLNTTRSQAGSAVCLFLSG